MKSNLVSRNEKIEIIKNLLKGKQLKQLLPRMKVSLIEHTPGKYFVDVENDQKKNISASDADGFVERLKAENKGKTIEVTVIYHNEYIALSEELEKKY